MIQDECRLGKLEAECAAKGRGEEFTALQAFLSAKPDAEEYARTAAQLNLTEGALRVAVRRLRKKMGEHLRAEISQTVNGPEEVESELRELFAALAG